MSESKVQTQILKWLKNKGYVAFKATSESGNGVSDIVACSPRGEFIAIEVKAPGKLKGVSKLQEVFLQRVSARGGKAILADSLEMVIKDLK